MAYTDYEAGDKVVILPGAVGTAGKYIGETLTVAYVDSCVEVESKDGEIFPCWRSEIKLYQEERKMFKKEDIKPGMAVELRNGAKGIMIPAEDHPKCIVLIEYENGTDGWMNLSKYDDSLFSNGRDGAWSIDRVYGFSRNYRKARGADFSERTLLWEREPEVKEVTMAEVEEKFGCKVKIVKED